MERIPINTQFDDMEVNVMNDFEFYSSEHVNKLQMYIEKNYAMGGCSAKVIRNALDYAAEQSEDDESALLILEKLLDGIGITRKEIISAVTQ